MEYGQQTSAFKVKCLQNGHGLSHLLCVIFMTIQSLAYTFFPIRSLNIMKVSMRKSCGEQWRNGLENRLIMVFLSTSRQREPYLGKHVDGLIVVAFPVKLLWAMHSNT